jgi:hypothetical protein
MLFEPPLGGNIWLLLGAAVPVIMTLAYVWLYVQSRIEKKWGEDDNDDAAG